MGSGKSTIGRALAKRTKYRFVDMDREIELRQGKSVSEIFATVGEPFFRGCERQLLEELVARGAGGENMIVSTGGGVPCFGNNMALMNRGGMTVYLKMSPEKLTGRLRFGKAKRPTISGMADGALLAHIEENLAGRERYYGQATMTLDCDGVSDEYICRNIEMLITHTAEREE